MTNLLSEDIIPLAVRRSKYGGIAQLVEHSVHTRSVICSSQIAATRPVGQAVKTPPFHGGNMGSIPVRVTTSSRTALVRDDFFMLCIKSHLSPASSLLLSEMQTLRWFAFRFLFFGLIHSVQLTQVNETRFSNSFIEKRVSSCLQSLEKPRLFFFIC